ncbi:MAG: HAMP domain-containing histidine kinase, partial [Proteobacteria bacterium]|nr:HAMP domain-containing histidine kinase [Pseudomonadota bacterium]
AISYSLPGGKGSSCGCIVVVLIIISIIFAILLTNEKDKSSSYKNRKYRKIKSSEKTKKYKNSPKNYEKKLYMESIVDPSCIQGMTDFLTMLFKTGYGSNETMLTSSDSRLVRVEMIAATIRLGREGEQLACCFVRDITERKRLEEELVQSEKLAIIGKMSACLAHEINNPIGIILAHTEDIISGELDPKEVNESLHSIQRNAIRAGQITESLLTQASFKEDAFKNLDLADVLEVCTHFIKPKLKNISIHKDLPSCQYFVYGDEISLQQAFINLLLNAIESIPGTGGKINVEIEHKTIEGQLFVEAWIKDTGKGIIKKEVERIFDPFFTSGKHRGFGIGLFVAHHIIKKHGGKIIPISVEKAGTVMHVRLPAAKKE